MSRLILGFTGILQHKPDHKYPKVTVTQLSGAEAA
jgi:hypothetical protein